MAKITWKDKSPYTAQQIASIEATTQYSSDFINTFLARPINWDVSITYSDSPVTPNAIASANSDTKYWYKDGNTDIYLKVPQYQTMIGSEASGSDANISIYPKYFDSIYFDPTPSTSNDLPQNSLDAVSIFIHELLHALAFGGWTDWSTGINSKPYASTFDRNIIVADGKPFFIGENVAKLAGSRIPLTIDNLFHVGDTTNPNNPYKSDIMNPSTTRGQRYSISEIDLAILADNGIGTIRNDILNGSPLDDNIAAGKGNDLIRASKGNDKIDGGDELDYVAFAGNASTFSLSNAANGTVTVTNSSLGTDTLNNVERVRFTDKVLAFDTTGNAGQAFRMYKAALDRTPDERGLAGWIKYMDDGGTLKSVAQQFIDSQEFKKNYGNLDNRNFVNQLYLNVLDRNGEAAGINGWVNGLSNGLSRADVLKGFSESTENQANVAKLIGNGISYTEWWLS